MLQDIRAKQLIDLLAKKYDALSLRDPIVERYIITKNREGISKTEINLRFEIFEQRYQEYQLFQQKIWNHQYEEEISGIEWQEVTYCGYAVQVPRLHDELTAIPGDQEVVSAARGDLLKFVQDAAKYFGIWRSAKTGDTFEDWRETTIDELIRDVWLNEWIDVRYRDYINEISDLEIGEEWEEPCLEIVVEIYSGVLGKAERDLCEEYTYIGYRLRNQNPDG
jgi:hypothetical protein